MWVEITGIGSSNFSLHLLNSSIGHYPPIEMLFGITTPITIVQMALSVLN